MLNMKVAVLDLYLLVFLLFDPCVRALKGKKTMEYIESEELEGSGIILIPSNGQYDSVILWFHGLGELQINTNLSFS